MLAPSVISVSPFWDMLCSGDVKSILQIQKIATMIAWKQEAKEKKLCDGQILLAPRFSLDHPVDSVHWATTRLPLSLSRCSPPPSFITAASPWLRSPACPCLRSGPPLTILLMSLTFLVSFSISHSFHSFCSHSFRPNLTSLLHISFSCFPHPLLSPHQSSWKMSSFFIPVRSRCQDPDCTNRLCSSFTLPGVSSHCSTQLWNGRAVQPGIRFVVKLWEAFSPVPLEAAFRAGLAWDLAWAVFQLHLVWPGTLLLLPHLVRTSDLPCCNGLAWWSRHTAAPVAISPAPCCLFKGHRLVPCGWGAAIAPALTQRPPPAQRFSEQPQQDLWMQQFVSFVW